MSIVGTLHLGLIYSLLAMGIFITFRIMDTADLTADGSFALGLCVSGIAAAGGHPFAGLALGFVAGAAAGVVTGLLQTKGGIHPILAGILTMTALYSVNLLVMRGTPNVSLLGVDHVFALFQGAVPLSRGAGRLVLTAVFAGGAGALVWWFFRTGLGLRVRATGDNEQMVRATSINADACRIVAVALANGVIGLSGAVLAQYQGYADINAGTGIVIVGLASVIIGEAFVKRGGVLRGLVSAVIGSVVYRLLIALVLYYNVFPAYMLKFFSAVIVAVALAMPHFKRKGRRAHA
jgi:putative ABC transport system permease protein